MCGTELHFQEGLLDPMGMPRVLGHEIAGEGRGARVAVYNVMNCGSCRYCDTNRDRLCSRSKGMIGFTADGGFADYVIVPERNLVRLPHTVTFEAGAVLACSGMTAVHAVRLARIGIGDPVVVNGIGGVGLMLIQVAALAGATVLAVADQEAKLELAQDLGARAGLVIDDPEATRPFRRWPAGCWGGRLKCSSRRSGPGKRCAPVSVAWRPAAPFVQIGYTSQPLDIHPGALIKNELRILTSAAGSKNDLETAISLAAQGRLRSRDRDRTDLDGLEAAILSLRDRRVLGRNVVTFA